MGIDAHIVVSKVKRSVATEDTLKLWSWKLCQAIGAKKFFISDGLPPDEYEKANKAWHDAFKAHPLYAEYEAAYNTERNRGLFSSSEESRALGDRIRADIGEYKVEQLRMAIELTNTRYREDDEPPPGATYSDDGPRELRAAPDEVLLQLNLWGRYYGPGYERGDILTYCAIAEWLEQNIHGCEVWYGGDSGGVELKRFDAEYREELRKHLYSEEGRDYFNYGFGAANCRPKACGLCPGGKYLGSQYGSGCNYAAFNCAGCGKSVESRDNGKTWTEKKENE